jgi:hypothetical protein
VRLLLAHRHRVALKLQAALHRAVLERHRLPPPRKSHLD